jgi:hypothetical protein
VKRRLCFICKFRIFDVAHFLLSPNNKPDRVQETSGKIYWHILCEALAVYTTLRAEGIAYSYIPVLIHYFIDFLYISAMKLLLLLLCPLFSFAQSKGDTKIIVTTDSTGLFNKVAMVLYESGYSLAQKDEALKFMASNEKILRWANVKVNALVKGNEVILSGVFDPVVSVITDPEPIVYRGMKGSIYRTTFAELQAIADKIGGQIRYSK